MNHLLPILAFFILLNCLLKLSFLRLWKRVLLSLIAGIFVLIISPYASDQSKTEIASWLSDPKILQNVAVLISLDALIIFAFSIMMLREVFDGRVSKPYLLTLKYYPSLLLFPLLFYLLTYLYFNLPGIDFKTTAYTLALCTAIGLPLLSIGMGKLINELDFRLEVQFIVNLFVCCIGLISTVNGNTNYAAVKQEFNFRAMIIALSIFAILFACGFIIKRIKKITIKQ